MNLARLLAARAAAGKPITVGVIGAGKFGAMFLAMAARSPGIHVAVIADLAPAKARENLTRIGWAPEQSAASDLDHAIATRATFVTDNAALVNDPRIEVVVESTGNPAAGIRHALAAIAARQHIVMVNVEADVLAGPLLAAKAAAAGVVYSMAYGDQPALVCEMVDTIRAMGLPVIAAGKGTKYLPVFHASTPETVWGHYGLTPEQAAAGGMNPQMFNSFLDGTKSSIEMAAIANATGLLPPEDGLAFPPCGVQDLPHILRPRAEGGILPQKGMVEVISGLERDSRQVVGDLRWGVYAVFEGETDYIRRCFSEYGVHTDSTGHYAALWRPYHLIGLELAVSVASVALRREPTGCGEAWRGDAVATAKRPLKAGEILDGEGGAMVWGKCIPAARSLAENALPIGLAHGVKLLRDIPEGVVLRQSDVALDAGLDAVQVRHQMEALSRAA
ncbi:MAG: flagellar biosynthesis protein FlgA [Roseococcus sp.]|nr:flagellar biosynthesis protein FlgA [Roseococcus sp.]